MRIMHISRASLMVCQFMIPLIEAQKKRGDYVCVCGSDDSDAGRLRDAGIDVFVHRLKRSLNPLSIVREIIRIKRILVGQKIDVLVCHSPLGAGIGRIAARLARVAIIIYFAHGLPCAPGQNPVLWFVWFCIEKTLGRLTDAVLVMNDYDERLCRTRRLVPKTCKVIRIPGMGIDLQKFAAEPDEQQNRTVREKLGISPNKNILICLAYLIPAKGIFVYLDAAKEICAQRDDTCFLIAGTGPYMDKLISLRDSYGLREEFRILGWRDDIHQLMRSADIFVLPTYYFEGLPVSILEAMACGKPVVATQHRGCEDTVVDGKTGFLIAIKDAPALADRIQLLLDDEQLRRKMGRAARELVEREFGLELCTAKIIEALENACQK